MSFEGHSLAPGLYGHADFATYNAMKRAEHATKKARAVRLAQRDMEYASAHIPAMVEERDGKVIEWRGQRCIGGRSYGCFR